MKCKRLIAFAALIVMLAASLPLAALAETYATVISSDVLHLRSGPGSEYAVIGKYRNGTRVTILKTGKRWSRVRTPDRKVGYMYNQYLSPFRTTGSSSSSSGSTWTGTAIRYIKSGIGPVNFRKDASVNSKLLDQLNCHISNIQVRPDHNVCLSGNLALSLNLLLSYCRADGCI